MMKKKMLKPLLFLALLIALSFGMMSLVSAATSVDLLRVTVEGNDPVTFKSDKVQAPRDDLGAIDDINDTSYFENYIDAVNTNTKIHIEVLNDWMPEPWRLQPDLFNDDNGRGNYRYISLYLDPGQKVTIDGHGRRLGIGFNIYNESQDSNDKPVVTISDLDIKGVTGSEYYYISGFPSHQVVESGAALSSYKVNVIAVDNVSLQGGDAYISATAVHLDLAGPDNKNAQKYKGKFISCPAAPGLELNGSCYVYANNATGGDSEYADLPPAPGILVSGYDSYAFVCNAAAGRSEYLYIFGDSDDTDKRIAMVEEGSPVPGVVNDSYYDSLVIVCSSRDSKGVYHEAVHELPERDLGPVKFFDLTASNEDDLIGLTLICDDKQCEGHCEDSGDCHGDCLLEKYIGPGQVSIPVKGETEGCIFMIDGLEIDCDEICKPVVIKDDRIPIAPMLMMVGRNFPFVDVTETNWAYPYIREANKQNLINGKTVDLFMPDGDLTYAEAIKLAACANQLAAMGAVSFEPSYPWYQTYVSYAELNLIIDRGQYSGKMDSAINRYDFADIFASALPAGSYAPIKTAAPTDVPQSSAYYPAVLKLYQAGILTGDSNGAFNGNSNIKRSEAAAILIRLIDVEMR